MNGCKVLSGIFLALCSFFTTIAQEINPVSRSVYTVVRSKESITIDGNWNKRKWRKVKAIEIKNFIREQPQFHPSVQAKMMYDDENIFVIFRVQDRYVRSVTTEMNGPVWKDSAVEFFFSPDSDLPLNYFNLEVNCSGVPLLGYNSKSRNKPSVDDLKKIEIAHSLPGTVDPEIKVPITWTVEYRIPLRMLENYSKVTRPVKGVTWKANFYKIAEINSNPHHATWSVIDHPKPTFHLPQYFGTLKFQ